MVTGDGEWRPALNADAGSLHEQLMGALRREIAAGALAPGTRLPTHRELAQRLGIGIGTVTKAYAEASRIGLLTSQVGRGTYVAGASGAGQATELIDLTLNLAPLPPSMSRLPDALGRLRVERDLPVLAEFAPHLGFEAHRRAGAAWLRRAARLEDADWRRLAICGGAQQATFLALDSLCQPGDVVMAEAVTFHGFKSIAEYRGWDLIGLDLDGDGVRPEALEQAAASGRSKVLFLQPTLQNPTATTMPRSRRDEIVRIARRYDLTIVESDVYGPLAWRSEGPVGEDAVPLAVLAPERTFYASGLSKVVASGLRTGFLIVPDADALGKIAKAIRAIMYSASAFGPQIATHWIEDHVADDILRDIAGLASVRTAIARRRLGQWMSPPSHDGTLHTWVPLPQATAERVAIEARRNGVLLTPPSAPAVADSTVAGLRICACAPRDIETLERALSVIASALKQQPAEPQTIV